MFIVFLLSLCLGMVGPSSSRAEAADIPFSPGEELKFVVYWAFVPAGEAVLEILPSEKLNGVDCFHFRATARTYDYIDVFYRVRDTMDAFTDTSMVQSILYRKQQQGKTKRNVVVDFDWQRKEAQYSNFGETTPPVPIAPGTFDPLSIFYAFRLRDLEEGKEMTCPVSDGKKAIMGRAKVVRREKIRVGGKDFDTFLVEPELKHIGGIFEKSKKSTLQIWVTADRKRIPVRIKSGVTVGSFVAELASWKGGNKE